MADNTTINLQSGGDVIRDLARAAGASVGAKTQVMALDIGGASANAEVLVTAGQQTMATSLPVVLASNQTAVTVKDDYVSGQILADQAGSGAVLTFTFATAVDFIWVTDVGATTTNISRVDPFGGTPAASTGIPAFNATPTPINVVPAATVVKVFAPSGSTISMYGYRR